MSEAPPPASGPRYSDDGKFYWDGQHWVPVQSQTPAPVVVVKQPRGAWNSCVGYGCIGIALIFVFVAVTAWCGSNHP